LNSHSFTSGKQRIEASV